MREWPWSSSTPELVDAVQDSSSLSFSSIWTFRFTTAAVRTTKKKVTAQAAPARRSARITQEEVSSTIIPQLRRQAPAIDSPRYSRTFPSEHLSRRKRC